MNAVAWQSPLLPPARSLARSRPSCLPASPRRSSTNNTLRSSLHAQFIHDASCNDAAAISTAMRTCAISKQSQNCTLQKAGVHCPLHQVNPLPLLPCTNHLRVLRAFHFLPARLSSLKFLVLFLFAHSFFFFPPFCILSHCAIPGGCGRGQGLDFEVLFCFVFPPVVLFVFFPSFSVEDRRSKDWRGRRKNRRKRRSGVLLIAHIYRQSPHLFVEAGRSPRLLALREGAAAATSRIQHWKFEGGTSEFLRLSCFSLSLEEGNSALKTFLWAAGNL